MSVFREKALENFKKKYQPFGIEAIPFRSSLRLEGELDKWEDIVRIGRKAAKLGFKGVVNDIELKHYCEPTIRRASFTDGTLEGAKPDVLIIGGGVIGCAIAREFSKYNPSVLLVEKESDVAMHTSSRNDGMIHPGIASHADSLNGRMNVRGNAMYTQICKELSVPFKRLGNLILYSDHLFGKFAEPVFKYRQQKLGIYGKKLSQSELKRLEPNVTDKAIGAYSYPSSGVLSPYTLTSAFAENAVENGVQISFDTVVTGMELDADHEIVKVLTNRGTIYPRLVVNAAGVFTDKIAQMADDRFFSIHPRKGQILILDKKKGHLVQRSLGLVGVKQATSDTKGGGVMRTIEGNLLVGPDAYEVPEREDYATCQKNIDAIASKHLPLIYGLSKADIITYFAGIRAATYEEDFIIERSDYTPNLVHAAGMKSPGLASAPAVAQEIVKISLQALSPYMEIHKNPKFNPYRRVTPHLSAMSITEKQRAIASNPDYGLMVCRCESVSKGEILDALHSCLPPTSLDAIKRRTRAGTGRCQGGFCSPLVAEMISSELNIPMEQVTKNGDGTNVLLEKMPKGGKK